MKFLFITTNDLVTNPRLVKELELVVKNGHVATVLLFELRSWSSTLNRKTIDSFPSINFITLSANKFPFFPWLFGSILEKILRLIPIRFLPLWALSLAVSKRSLLLLMALRNIKDKYDWIIAHNPGSFYPALNASKNTHSKLGIDIEDYHPGETNNMKMNNLMVKYLKKILPLSNYVSFSSSLIYKKMKDEVVDVKSSFIILNGFWAHEFINVEIEKKSRLKLVWFSQNITYGRGLEAAIDAVDILFPEVELHLIGYVHNKFKEKMLSNKRGIILHGVYDQKKLHHYLGSCDVGICLDRNVNKNRELAISNKFMAYVQAGLYILASDNKAHTDFISNYGIDAETVGDSTENIISAMRKIINKKELIRNVRYKRFQRGRDFSWDTISIEVKNHWLVN